MAQPELKPGDLVKLKSGGPVMTYAGDGLCLWFAGGESRSATFPLEVLEPAQRGTAWVGIA